MKHGSDATYLICLINFDVSSTNWHDRFETISVVLSADQILNTPLQLSLEVEESFIRAVCLNERRNIDRLARRA